jgi:hypothetical protein
MQQPSHLAADCHLTMNLVGMIIKQEMKGKIWQNPIQ